MTHSKRVLIMDEVHPLIPDELTRHGYLCDYFPGTTRAGFLRIIDRYEGVIIRSRVAIDRDLLERTTRLKFIGRVGSGMEGIDVEAAQSKGIQCFNSPEGNRDAVGEHATGMLLALMNHMNRADREVRAGQWLREANRGTELKGKTVGIIGYGNMGRAFAQRLSGFEATVIAYDKYKRAFSDQFVMEVTLNEIKDSADVVSLHIPLTTETTGMVDTAFIASFGKPFWLINTSRGKVVETDALAEALKSGKVRGAALDVLEHEEGSFERLLKDPPPGFGYLVRADNVLLTPHIAGWTTESKEKLARVLVNKILQTNQNQ